MSKNQIEFAIFGNLKTDKAKFMISKKVAKTKLKAAFEKMCLAKSMATLYEEHFAIVSKYVHATSRGHEAIQIATGMQLLPQDFLSAYYRDDAMLLSIGMEPFDLMLQLLAKKTDPFSGGRTYYSHPSLNDPDKPTIPHQSSATGMQAIPTTGIALGIQYKEQLDLDTYDGKEKPVVICSLGDASVTEGEVAEALQMAALRQLPICFLVQDNEWDISASADEIRAQNAYEYAKGFHGIEAISIDGTNFQACFNTMKHVVQTIRKERRPFLVHASVPLLNHHTSGVRMEWYRDDLEEDFKMDPFPKMIAYMLENGFTQDALSKIQSKAEKQVAEDLERAMQEPNPKPSDLWTHDFAPTPITEESGDRSPVNGEAKVMVDSALFAIKEIMTSDKRCLLYGQDVGKRLGGVFREAATLAQTFGDERVFNTPIQEAFIVGSTVGMSAVGLKPIVEVQFADYIFPGINQLFTEVARSCYLSNGKFPVSMILRVPIGAYGSGGPYHSSSVESIISNIRGIKIAYPSNGADLKGLIKAAYHDPNPVVIFEHKGLYWSKVRGTDAAKTIMPAEDYILPLGQAAITQSVERGSNSMTIITYGMGVHWALNASKSFAEQVEIIDLRTLYPLDETTIFNSVRKHGKCLVVTEESKSNSFAQALAGRIQEQCFESLDAPIKVIGAADMPAIPLNETLEKTMIPSIEKVEVAIQDLLAY